MLQLKIITPRKIAIEKEVDSVTVPTSGGEITILSHHANLFSLLVEGVIKFKKNNTEEFLAIGGGYLQTDGEKVIILVSKAFGQDEIDQEITQKAIDEAQKILKASKGQKERTEAIQLLRQSLINLKLLKKRKAPRSFRE